MPSALALVSAFASCLLAVADPTPSPSASPEPSPSSTCTPSGTVTFSKPGNPPLIYFPEQPIRSTSALSNDSATEIRNTEIYLGLIAYPYADAHDPALESHRPVISISIDNGPWQSMDWEWTPRSGSMLSSWVSTAVALPALAPKSQHILGFWISVPDATPAGNYYLDLYMRSIGCFAVLWFGSGTTFSYNPGLRPKALTQQSPAASLAPSATQPAMIPDVPSAEPVSSIESPPPAAKQAAASHSPGRMATTGGIGLLLLIAGYAALRALRAHRSL